jgi:hypothetical protein
LGTKGASSRSKYDSNFTLKGETTSFPTINDQFTTPRGVASCEPTVLVGFAGGVSTSGVKTNSHPSGRLAALVLHDYNRGGHFASFFCGFSLSITNPRLPKDF